MNALSRFRCHQPFCHTLHAPSRSPQYRRPANAFSARPCKATEIAQPGLATASDAFSQFLSHLRIDHALELKQGPRGYGLHTTITAPKGSVLLAVPQSLCISINNESGELSLPGAGEWPRLCEGLGTPEPLTWDVLEALALMDAVAGDGDRFYEAYVDMLLPDPEKLTLPMCWHEQLLQELQHRDIVEAAQQQQARLRSLLPPGYLDPISPTTPSWLQWAFACVRSRAFALSPAVMAFVPFFDLANHAATPNADFRVKPAVNTSSSSSGPETSSSSSSSSAGSSRTSSGPVVELLAVKDIAAGEEVLVSYSGPQGFTNQRFMAQYGFVPEGGNMADRLSGLQVPEGLQTKTLRLSYLQDALGDAVFMDAARGNNPYLFAALKSLPLADEEPQQQQEPVQAAVANAGEEDIEVGAAGGGEAGAAAAAAGGHRAAASSGEQQLATALLAQVDAELDSCSTSLQEDEKLLLQLLGRSDSTWGAGEAAVGPAGGSGGADEDGDQFDVRLIAAVRYRIERKRLLHATQLLLKLFLR